MGDDTLHDLMREMRGDVKELRADFHQIKTDVEIIKAGFQSPRASINPTRKEKLTYSSLGGSFGAFVVAVALGIFEYFKKG